MTKHNINSKKGFTIIEVVLVLAIAGLIFLMVFIALPNLQRTQRDTQRRNDLDRASSAMIQYVTNNNKLPKIEAESGKTFSYGKKIKEKTDVSTLGQFYYNYLLANGGDTFEDPSGGNYNIAMSSCSKTAEGNTECKGGYNKTGPSDTGSPLSTGFVMESPDSADSNYTMVIFAEAKCSGDETSPITYEKGARHFAIAMRLEGNGVYCVSN